MNELIYFNLLFDDKLIKEIIENSEEYFGNKFLKNINEQYSKNSYAWLISNMESKNLI